MSGLKQLYEPTLILLHSPAPVKWHNTTSGQDVYLFPDINFGKLVYLRVSSNLSEVQYDESNSQSNLIWRRGITI